ncbi:acetyl-CoA hydrolase/transferase C-terminal domain-containing protein [Thermocladium modestius]|nr:acetyl-CoA hydrolase/transferase C-terminal domain-containing protein [Thermocladium modestius]
MDRVKCGLLDGLVMDASDAVRRLVPRVGTIATGGMSGVAVPKEFPRALADYVGEVGGFSLTLLTGGATSAAYEDALSRIPNAVRARYPYLSGGLYKELANRGSLSFFDYGLNKFNKLVRRGFIKVDLAVFEATAVMDDCGVVPSISLDAVPSFIQGADKVVIEVNESKPVLEGLHDTYSPGDGEVIPIRNVTDRVGGARIMLPREKIGAVIITNAGEGVTKSYKPPARVESEIAEKAVEFMAEEAGRGFFGRLREAGRLVMQPGGGPLASALADAVQGSGLSLGVWAETLPVKWTELIGGPINGISASALYALPGEEPRLDKFLGDYRDFVGRVVIRGQEVSNNPEVIQRLGVISIQQALEVDIYGNANISHIGGDVYNGVGGSVDFAPSASLLIIALPSTTSDGLVSRIVPATGHVDVPEHYVDVVVTEQGVADLRGLPPRDRARAIIENCAHPRFRDGLLKYYEAVVERRGGHEPYDLGLAGKWLND